jgi:hypothetical protein
MATHVSTRGLTAAIRAALAAHDAEQKSGRVRAIDSTDEAPLVAAVRRTLKLAQPSDIAATVRLHGGFVPGSYRYSAAGDIAEVTVDLRADTDRDDPSAPRWVVSVYRGRAAKRPHGNGEYVVCRLLRPGQSQGRLLDLSQKGG